MRGARKKISKGKSRKMFTKSASFVHPKNAPDTVMRGGIRL